MAKQYFIVTKNPAAGRPEWHVEGGIGFNSLANAELVRRNRIETLRRSKTPMKDREWAIMVFDADEILKPITFWSRVKNTFKDLGGQKPAKLVAMSETEFRKAQAANTED